MRKNTYILLFFTLLSTLALLSQQVDIYLKNPLPTDQNITRFTENSSGKIFAITPEDLMVTSDDGNTWLVQEKITGAKDITFKNGLGYIVGDDLVLKSTDDGETWLPVDIGHTDTYAFHSVNITDNGNVFICSDYSLYKELPHEWSKIHEFEFEAPTVRTIFLNDNVAHAVGKNNRIRKTINGGSSWQLTHGTVQGSNNFSDVFFVNETIGFATAREGIYKTTDTGNTWNVIDPSVEDFTSVFFTSENVGYVTDGQIIYKTEDSGNTWDEINIINDFSGYDYLNTIFFKDSNKGFVGGNMGVLFSTDDSGENWNNYSFTNRNFKDLDMVDSSVGYIVSDKDIFKTIDEGNTWLPLNNPISFNPISSFISYIEFVGNGIGYLAAGDKIYKTSDDGQNWTEIRNTFNIISMLFIDELNGYYSDSLSDDQFVYKTTDGGNTWISVADFAFEKMIFVSENRGFAIAKPDFNSNSSSKSIYKTEDGGNTWSLSYDSNFVEVVNGFYFINENIGYAVGNEGLILKTINGGVFWDELSTSLGSANVRDVIFLRGVLYILTNELFFASQDESNWSLVEDPYVTNITSIGDLFFLYGNVGRIYSNMPNNTLSTEDINDKSILGNVFPNPTDNIFTIQLTLNSSIKSYSLYDLRGKEVLKKEYQVLKNLREVDIDNLSKGMYLLRVLNNEGEFFTKKIIVSK
ncbi:MAG: T9SS type A sorting domain-containing protein [Flavobacteriaceae bacterium]